MLYLLCLFFCQFSALCFFALVFSSMFGVHSSAGLLLFNSLTLDLSLRSVFFFSALWFFALLARSLRFNTM